MANRDPLLEELSREFTNDLQRALQYTKCPNCRIIFRPGNGADAYILSCTHISCGRCLTLYDPASARVCPTCYRESVHFTGYPTRIAAVEVLAQEIWRLDDALVRQLPVMRLLVETLQEDSDEWAAFYCEIGRADRQPVRPDDALVASAAAAVEAAGSEGFDLCLAEAMTYCRCSDCEIEFQANAIRAAFLLHDGHMVCGGCLQGLLDDNLELVGDCPHPGCETSFAQVDVDRKTRPLTHITYISNQLHNLYLLLSQLNESAVERMGRVLRTRRRELQREKAAEEQRRALHHQPIAPQPPRDDVSPLPLRRQQRRSVDNDLMGLPPRDVPAAREGARPVVLVNILPEPRAARPAAAAAAVYRVGGDDAVVDLRRNMLMIPLLAAPPRDDVAPQPVHPHERRPFDNDLMVLSPRAAPAAAAAADNEGAAEAIADALLAELVLDQEVQGAAGAAARAAAPADGRAGYDMDGADDAMAAAELPDDQGQDLQGAARGADAANNGAVLDGDGGSDRSNSSRRGRRRVRGRRAAANGPAVLRRSERKASHEASEKITAQLTAGRRRN